MTSENVRKDGSKKWSQLTSDEEKASYIVGALKDIFGPFSQFNGKRTEGVVLCELPEYSFYEKFPNDNENGNMLKEVEQMIQEMTDIPPLIERVELLKPTQNGKLKVPSEVKDEKRKQNSAPEKVENGNISVDGIFGVMCVDRPLSPLLTSAPVVPVTTLKSPKAERSLISGKQMVKEKVSMKQNTEEKIPKINVQENEAKDTKPSTTKEKDNGKTTSKGDKVKRSVEVDKNKDTRSSSRNSSPPKKVPKLARENSESSKKPNEKSKDTIDRSKKSERDRESKHKESSEKKSSSKDENASNATEKAKKKDKSPEKQLVDKKSYKVESRVGSERNVATPDIRPSSRLNSNKPNFRTIKPPSFALGEYEGYDFQGPSRSELPDQCVFMNRKKVPSHQELLSSVRQFIRGIPPSNISLGCMTRSLYSVGLLLYSLSPSHTTTESDLRQALILLRSVSDKLFNNHSVLPKNRHIVRGLLCLSEALVCTRIHQEHHAAARNRRMFLRKYEDELRPDRDVEDGEILESDFLNSLVVNDSKETLKEIKSDTVQVPKLLYKLIIDENSYARIAEQAMLASVTARNELEVQEPGLLRRLREMRFDLEGSASSLGDAIFTVSFWMQRGSQATRFKPKSDSSSLKPT
ncbi:unnamed protein product [Bursaphelenchus okinawaensis]|uniref:Uncharacterized protein n=1 Tax=Bursaphelenchus okinawaensis TaxID=465554 RepID=A0A811KIJ9_9BILA|nr:unnamed protein product [Bursaphelenchus okinawaensis]CAG9103878.1 unnamed protein product [Bursaphelenchus okinawaensis]